MRPADVGMTAPAAANADTSFARQQANQAFTASEGVVPYVAQTLEGLAGREKITADVRGCFD